MYYPKFTITAEILENIGQIEASRAIIDNAPLVPAYEKSFRHEATARMIHYGTRIEGNELSFSQAKEVMDGGNILAGKRDVQEVINYRQVINFIEKLINDKEKEKAMIYREEDLRKVHPLVTQRIIPEEKCGHYRQSQVIIRSASGKTVFRAPPAIEVPYLIASFFKFLNSSRGHKIHPVLRAGIAHYVLVAIHPFTEGNGRSARALANLILYTEKYDVRRLFSLEEFFDKNLEDYYGFLKKTSDQNKNLEERNLTAWLTFFSHALAIELNRVKEQIKKLSIDGRLRKKLGGRQISLSSRQIKLMEYINEHGGIRMAAARKILPMISEDTILRELQKLRDDKILSKVGRTRGVKYILR